MTAYNAIADSDIDPESPGTTTLFTRLRDNPIAITEGAAGAPPIANAALAGYPFSALTGDLTEVGYVQIDYWAATATASHTFTWNEATYGDVLIVINNITPATDADSLYVTFGYNNGASFYTTHTYTNLALGGTTLNGATTTNFISTPTNDVGNAAIEGVAGTIRLMATGSIVTNAVYNAYITYMNSAGTSISYAAWGRTNTAVSSATDTVKLEWASAGNFKAQGDITIYALLR